MNANTPAKRPESGELRSVIFVAGKFEDLLNPRGSGFHQLDGVLELMDLANAYVLSEYAAIGGAPVSAPSYEISKFLRQAAQHDSALELIGHDRKYPWELGPFEDRARMDSLVQRLDALDRDEHPEEERKLFAEVNILQADAYIRLADSVGAVYIPDRLFGVAALERYRERAVPARQLAVYEEFRGRLEDRLRRPGELASAGSAPSFLLEALRNARTWEGIFASLRDMRYSDAARRYRELVRKIDSDVPAERLEAREELERGMDAAFRRDGYSSTLDRRIVHSARLSAAAMAYLFPAVAPVIAFAGPSLAPAIESLHSWVGRRQNIFEFHREALWLDFFDELVRVFPAIKFKRENLDHFLRQRDFGWSEELDFWRKTRTAAP